VGFEKWKLDIRQKQEKQRERERGSISRGDLRSLEVGGEEDSGGGPSEYLWL
jgi:hypothetical protein